MSPRLEISIPNGQEEAFRKHVASFPGAKIIFDEGEATARKADYERKLRERIAASLTPKEPELETKIAEGYRSLLTRTLDPFSTHLNYQSYPFQISTSEELDRVRTFIHEACTNFNDPRKEVILIERHGLTDGQPKKIHEIAEIIGYTSSTVRTLEMKTLRGLRRPLRSFLEKK